MGAGEEGIAIVLAMMATVLLTAIGTGLVLTTTGETMIARNFRAAVEARYAATSMAEFVRAELEAIEDWDQVLGGATRSAFADGLPTGERTLRGGVRVDLARVANLARCGRASTCTTAQMDATTRPRPWGPNNPRWQLFAYGSFEDLVGRVAPVPGLFVTALVGDDGLETDGDPARDGSGPGHAGAGVVLIRAEAFGAGGTHAAVEVTVVREAAGQPVRVASSWQL